MNTLDTLLLYDENRPSPGLDEILLWTIIILTVSNLVFMGLCYIMGIKATETLNSEKNKEYIKWKAQGVSIFALFCSEIFNSSLYSPIAEEMVFRILLLKLICVRGLGLNFWVANFIQANVFGLMHLSNVVYSQQTETYTNLQTMSAVVSGLISGFAYMHTNSILPSTLAHMFNNATAGCSEAWGYWKYLKEDTK